jgi:tubulin polyglutamylase TTLL6/13
MDGLKFDLRIYVLVFGVDPLRIFLYKDGLTRLATEPYKGVGNAYLDQMCMHLTNYAVNKENENFI